MYTLLMKRFALRSAASRTSIRGSSWPAWARVAHAFSTRLGNFFVISSAVAADCRDLLADEGLEVQYSGALRATLMNGHMNWHVGCIVDADRHSRLRIFGSF